MEPVQARDPLGAEQVHPRGEHLAQLHERGTELLERSAELPSAFTRRRSVSDETNFAEHAKQALPPGDLSHFEGALQPF